MNLFSEFIRCDLLALIVCSDVVIKSDVRVSYFSAVAGYSLRYLELVYLIPFFDTWYTFRPFNQQ